MKEKQPPEQQQEEPGWWVENAHPRLNMDQAPTTGAVPSSRGGWGDVPEEDKIATAAHHHEQQQVILGGKRKQQDASDEHLVGKLKRVHLIEQDVGSRHEEGHVNSTEEEAWGNTMYRDMNRMLGDAHREMLRRSQHGL